MKSRLLPTERCGRPVVQRRVRSAAKLRGRRSWTSRGRSPRAATAPSTRRFCAPELDALLVLKPGSRYAPLSARFRGRQAHLRRDATVLHLRQAVEIASAEAATGRTVHRLHAVQKQVAAAARRALRDRSDGRSQLVAVSVLHPAEDVQGAGAAIPFAMSRPRGPVRRARSGRGADTRGDRRHGRADRLDLQRDRARLDRPQPGRRTTTGGLGARAPPLGASVAGRGQAARPASKSPAGRPA
jgi:hypothetical protein